MDTTNFTSKKVSKTATFLIDADIETLFRLYDAFEERKWEKGWDPELIYPATEIIDEGTSFLIKGHNEEPEYLWVVSQFDPENYHIQYLVSTPNRYWTITVDCKEVGDVTETQVTYSFYGLNEKGNELNERALTKNVC